MPDRQPSWKIKSNNEFFEIDEEQLQSTSIVEQSANRFHCIIGNRSVNTTIISSAGKKFIVEIEGEQYAIEIKDQLDQLLDEMGFSKAASRQVKEIKAPMPGLVLEINAAEGQEVKEGDKLLILGAMKMENAITAVSDSVVKSIAVSAGQAVEKGQLLISFA